MRRVMFESAGGPEVLRVVEFDPGPPRVGEVSIDVSLIGLNRFETQYRRDAYAYSPELPSPLGAEGVGIVRAVGPGVAGFVPGDRVTVMPTSPAVGTGMYADRANVPTASVVRALASSTDEQEAAFWCAYLTAYGLLTKAPAPKGSHVLVTAAACSVGVALLQMTRDMGLRSIATTRSRLKVDALKALGADHVIVTDEESIAERVASFTEGQGVPIAVDALGGRFTADIVAATAQDGAVRMIGSLSEPSMRGDRVELPMFALYRKTIGFASFYEVVEDRPRFAQAQEYLRDGFARGALVPQTDRTFALDDIVAAHLYLEKGGQIGKVLCSPTA